MSVALVLSSQTIDVALVQAAVDQAGANVKAHLADEVGFDQRDRAGIAELAAYVRAENVLCLRDMDVGLYEASLFDAVFEPRTVSLRAQLLVSAVEVSITDGARTHVALLNEWDGLASTRLLRGGVNHLCHFLEVDGGWPALRFTGLPSAAGELQTNHGTVVFQVAG